MDGVETIEYFPCDEEVEFSTDSVFAYDDEEHGDTIYFTGANPLDVILGDGEESDEFFIRAQPTEWLNKVEDLLKATTNDQIYLDWDGTICLTASTDSADMAMFSDEECVELYLGGLSRMLRLRAILANPRVFVLTAQKQSRERVLKRFGRIVGLLDVDESKIHVVRSGGEKLTLLQEKVKEEGLVRRASGSIRFNRF